MSYQYAYLIGCLILFLVWLALFLFRRDVRREMILISLAFGVAGLFVDPIYSSDWWFPKTLTNTMPGIEDFIFGFAVAGIASVLYLELFSKKLRINKISSGKKTKENINYVFLMTLVALLFFGSFFLLKLNSFWASFPAFLIPTLIIWIKRKDLIKFSIISGLLLPIVSFIFYIIPEMLFPGWISNSWNFEMLSGFTLFSVPIEELIWYFLAGCFIGPLYEYWKDEKLVNKK
jgi:hypothetical protein